MGLPMWARRFASGIGRDGRSGGREALPHSLAASLDHPVDTDEASHMRRVAAIQEHHHHHHWQASRLVLREVHGHEHDGGTRA